MLYRIRNERLDAPFAAMYDIEEATRRFPAMKEKLAADSEKIARAQQAWERSQNGFEIAMTGGHLCFSPVR